MRTRILAVLPMLLSFQGAASLPLLAMQVITPTVDLHFGSIAPIADSSCSIGRNGIVSGDCDISDGNIRTAQIQISSLTSNSALQIQVTGSDNALLSFLSITDISGGVSGPSTVNDNTQVLVTTDGAGTPIDLIIYGQLRVLSDITPGASLTVNYDISVTYQ